MNAAIDHMRAFTPADPYLLTVRQDEVGPYQYEYGLQSRQWLHNTPFSKHEHESLQYQTFVWHEQGKDIFTLKNSRPLDSVTGADTNGTADVKGKEKAGTGANTPNAGAKKKISLDAYKKKQTGQTPDATTAKELGQQVKKPAAKGPVERLKEDEEVLAAVEEDVSIQAQKDAAAAEEKKDLKRKREAAVEETKDTKEREKKNAQNDTPQEVSEPATKKMKPTPPAEQHASTNDTSKAVQPPPEPRKAQEHTSSPSTDDSKHLKLPPKLSPLSQASDEQKKSKMPPKLSPIQSAPEYDKLPPKLSPLEQSSDDDKPPPVPPLPPRLSPTLPANMEATRKAPSHLRSLSRASDKSLSKDTVGRTLTPPPTNPGKKKSPAPRNGFRANSSSPAVRSDAEERGRPVTSVPRRLKSPDVDSEDESDGIIVARKGKAVPKPYTREALSKKSPGLVKLKFTSKSAKDRLRSLLKMKAAADKSLAPRSAPSKTTTVRGRDRRDTGTKGVAQRVKLVRAANGELSRDGLESPPRKRSRSDNSDESEALPIKSNRSDNSDKSETPPIKRKRATTDASESKTNEVTTPTIQSNPISPPSVQKSTTQLSPGNLRKDALSVTMKRELSNDSNMHTPSAMSQASPGKDGLQPTNGVHVVKPPSSQPSAKTPKQQAWEAEQKRLANIGRELKHEVETVAEPMRAAAVSLESLLAFVLAFVCADKAALAADPKKPPTISVWRSMQGYFGAVKKKCEPFPALLGVACYLGVVFNAHILDLTIQFSSDPSGTEFWQTQAMMQRAANEAESKLDIDTLQSTFPRTWAKRAKGALIQPSLEPGKGYKVSYKLPLGVQTSPLRAVRAGHAMLEEWLEKQKQEGLDYAMKLKL